MEWCHEMMTRRVCVVESVKLSPPERVSPDRWIECFIFTRKPTLKTQKAPSGGTLPKQTSSPLTRIPNHVLCWSWVPSHINKITRHTSMLYYTLKDLVMASLELFIQGWDHFRSLLKKISIFGSRSFAPRDFASTFYSCRLESPFPCELRRRRGGDGISPCRRSIPPFVKQTGSILRRLE